MNEVEKQIKEINKYIVKNCPACIISPSCCAKYHIDNGHAKDCQDIEDCVIKQVIEKCNERIEPFKYGIPEHPTDTAMTYTEKRCKADFAMQILDMFDIEEINK